MRYTFAGLLGAGCVDGRTDPSLWKKSKKQAQDEACRSGTRRCGTWDARMAQRSGAIYRAAGGGYCGGKTKSQRSMTKWTREKWTTANGKKACKKVRGKVVCDRYLPAKAWADLTPAQREATRRVKKAAKGQFVRNTPAAARAGKKARK